MVDSRAVAAAAKKAKINNRDKSDEAAVQKSLAEREDGITEPQISTTPGSGPVETIVQPELVYDEPEEDGDGVNPLGDPGEEDRQGEEPDFIEYMKSVPSKLPIIMI
ncbi:hypothetical protein PtB15_18B480 [Puccinia triticina]|nr:hypothetical protein PtB15_18B480 [Puccinia triticina]